MAIAAENPPRTLPLRSAASSSIAYRRIEHARRWLSKRSRSEELVILGGTLESANGVARSVHGKAGSIFGWNWLTLAQLVSAVAAPELASRQITSISRLASQAIIARVVHDLRSAGALGRHEPIADTPGFPKAVADTILEFRLSATSLDLLRIQSPDLAAIAEAYQGALQNAGLVDWPAIVGVATELASSTRPRLFGLPTLLLDVPIASELELRFVEKMASAAKDFLAVLPKADAAGMAAWRYRMRMAVADLDIPEVQPFGSTPSANSLRRLQNRLFDKQGDQTNASPPDASADIFSAPGEGRECVEIARRVLAAAGSGIPFDRIAILLRAPLQYRGPLEEAFGRARVPMHFARGSARPDPAGRAFRALLRCALDSVSAARFAEYLSVGQNPDSADGPTSAPPGEVWIGPEDTTGRSAAQTEPSEPDPPRSPRRADCRS